MGVALCKPLAGLNEYCAVDDTDAVAAADDDDTNSMSFCKDKDAFCTARCGSVLVVIVKGGSTAFKADIGEDLSPAPPPPPLLLPPPLLPFALLLKQQILLLLQQALGEVIVVVGERTNGGDFVV